MNPTGLPFDDIRALFKIMPLAAADCVADVRARDAQLTKPAGSLGRLKEIVEFLAAWQGKSQPTIDRPQVVVFAANHGVVAQGVSPYPQAVTRAMMENFSAGGAAINQICATHGLGLKVFDLALEIPTGDITQTAALDEKSAAAILHAIDPTSLDHCMAAHASAEGAHGEVLRRLGKKPLLDLGMRLGEGSGAALATGIVKAALACHADMATFASAGVPEKDA